jgi:uncharacterized membrane protein
MTRPATMIRILIGLHLIWTFLLTPVALEPRPFSVINPIGWLSLALIFTTVTLDIVAFVLVARNTRLAATLAAVGAVLFVGPYLGDLAGLFASQRAPFQIVVVETIAFVTQLGILYFALRLRRESVTA